MADQRRQLRPWSRRWCAPTRAREKAHQNLTTFLVEKPAGFGEVLPGLTIPGKIDKMGYKGVDTTELVFDGYRTPADDVLGGGRAGASPR